MLEKSSVFDQWYRSFGFHTIKKDSCRYTRCACYKLRSSTLNPKPFPVCGEPDLLRGAGQRAERQLGLGLQSYPLDIADGVATSHGSLEDHATQ